MFDDPEAIETTFADLIEPNQIAFTIAIDSLRAVGGQVEPGDFVDIIVSSSFDAAPVAATGLDVFENTQQESVYTNPARFLYRGVRIVGIDSEFVGQATEEGVAAAPAAAGALQITLALPAESAQRILSVDPGELTLALHPEDWDPNDPQTGAIANNIPELIQLGGDLPGENSQELTPYGPDGFIDVLADAAEAEADAVPAPAPEPADAAPEADVSNEEG